MRKERIYKSERYSAVVESGGSSPDYKRYEERENCGHAHRTIKGAVRCLDEHLGRYHVNGSYNW